MNSKDSIMIVLVLVAVGGVLYVATRPPPPPPPPPQSGHSGLFGAIGAALDKNGLGALLPAFGA